MSETKSVARDIMPTRPIDVAPSVPRYSGFDGQYIAPAPGATGAKAK